MRPPAASSPPPRPNKVRALIKDPAIAAEIQQDVELGQKANVNQTPTMVVTHRLKQYPLSGTSELRLAAPFPG